MRKMKKIQTALWIIIVIFCCTGCSDEKREQEELSSLFIEDSEDTENKTDENDSDISENRSTDKSDVEEKNEETKTKESSVIFVYVCGAVQDPGVYEIPSDSRLYEVINKAGGLLPDAAKESINQARILEDAEQIYIPTEAEVEKQKSNNEAVDFWQFQQESSNLYMSDNIEESEEEKVNINTASKEELMTLKGIGATRAESILSYRKSNGGFESIEELMEVEGIKEGVFDKIKDSITTGAGS